MPKEKKKEVVVKKEISSEEKKTIAPVIEKQGWRKVTVDELATLQKEGTLIGYNPDTQEALVKE